jgi:RNA polymerase sigma factor (sigma-70 family)
MPGTEDQQHRRERRFAALYQEHYRPILAYAVRRVASAEDAADVVADVFTTAWRRIDQVPEAPADRLWLYGVAQRVIGGRRRSARRLLRLTARLRADAGIRPLSQPELGQPGPGRPGLGQPGLRDATADHLLAALDQLTPGEREALQLVLWEQLSHAEAAHVLGCSANAVAIRVHRAKTRLRSELCRTGLPGTGPSGTSLSGNGPSGTGLSGSGPSGTGPSGTGPARRALSGTGLSGTETSSTRASSSRARIDRS